MYARGIPISVFSLALVIDGEPTIGVIYDPFTDNMYHAVKNKGAYKNEEKIKVNSIPLNDMRSVSHYDMWPSSEYNLYNIVKELGKKTYFVSIGSIARACACIASGDFNLAIFPGITNKNCDIAAAKIIVEEAGGIVSDADGGNLLYDRPCSVVARNKTVPILTV
jgi:fructose-1,6-bisphosphatase/inositol monophosphatase family enzyme